MKTNKFCCEYSFRLSWVPLVNKFLFLFFFIYCRAKLFCTKIGLFALVVNKCGVVRFRFGGAATVRLPCLFEAKSGISP